MTWMEECFKSFEAGGVTIEEVARLLATRPDRIDALDILKAVERCPEVVPHLHARLCDVIYGAAGENSLVLRISARECLSALEEAVFACAPGSEKG